MSNCNCIFNISSIETPKAFSKRKAISGERLARPLSTALSAGRPHAQNFRRPRHREAPFGQPQFNTAAIHETALCKMELISV